VRPGEEDRAAAPPVGVDNRAQVLLAKSTDGGNSFSAPVKVADYYDLPDCETYQGKDPGVGCVPEKGETQNSFFRAANYPSAAVDPTDPRKIAVTFGSYINRHSNERLRNPCVPQGYNPDTFQPLYTGVKTAGACNNDILISRSTNGGTSFTGGSNDVRTLPATRDGPNFGTTRVTTASMPPPTQFAGTFFGDYSGLTADDVAHPAWMDTRDPDLFVCRDSAGIVTQPPSVCTAAAPNAAQANDQNVYAQALNIPTR
jgi:hypothetical protein